MLSENTYSESRISAMLHDAKVRPSVNRMAVLAYIANRKTHPTAEELFGALAEVYPSLSRTTVYNSLHALVAAGLVRELDMDSVARYDLAPQPAHSHFVCERCGKIFDMRLPEGLERAVAPGFGVNFVSLSFKGLCPDCMKTIHNQE